MGYAGSDWLAPLIENGSIIMDEYDEYTREDYIAEILDRMRQDKKYRPVVKKNAEAGDEICQEVMVKWNNYVKELRRGYAR